MFKIWDWGLEGSGERWRNMLAGYEQCFDLNGG